MEKEPIHGPLPASSPATWTAIAAPPAAVLAMATTPGCGQGPPLPPLSAGQTVCGPYVSDGWVYALMCTPNGWYRSYQWFAARASALGT